MVRGERCTRGRKRGLADALRGGRERKDFSWLSMRRKRIGVHRYLGGFGEREPISLEAEQYFSKAGSSRYSYMKLTSSHLYFILHCFSFFANPGIILLIGVDGKGHRLFYWDWLLTCLPRICLWSFPLARAHWKIIRCGFIWFLLCLFVIFLFSLFSTIHVFFFLSFLLVFWWLFTNVS